MYRVAMIGMGGISNAHRAAWKQITEAKVVACCDIRKENADKAAEEMGAVAYYDIDTCLASGEYDIVDICLPTYLHADTAIKALDKGINVISEKPISLKREDVRRVYDAAARNGKSFMVAQVLRWWREYDVLKDAIDTGKYGRLLSGHMTRLGNTPKWSWDGWMRDPERSGLVPFDLHIHDLDWMIYQFGKPERMTCNRASAEGQDYFEAIYHYPGFFIIAEAAWYDCQYKFQAGFRFQFEHAMIEWKDGEFTIYRQDGVNESLPEEEGANENGINLPKSNAYFNEIRYFVDCMNEGVFPDKVKAEQLETVLDLIAQLSE